MGLHKRHRTVPGTESVEVPNPNANHNPNPNPNPNPDPTLTLSTVRYAIVS